MYIVYCYMVLQVAHLEHWCNGTGHRENETALSSGSTPLGPGHYMPYLPEPKGGGIALRGKARRVCATQHGRFP